VNLNTEIENPFLEVRQFFIF